MAEIESALDELKGIFADFFEQEMDPFDHGDRTLNFMWFYSDFGRQSVLLFC